jgi:hypothetical protein
MNLPIMASSRKYIDHHKDDLFYGSPIAGR